MRFMNKAFQLFLLLTALVSLACQRDDLRQELQPRLRVEVSPITKGAEFTGSQPERLFITATQRLSDGSVTRPSLFLSGGDPSWCALEQIASSDVWLLSSQYFFPVGSEEFLDVIAFGVGADDGRDLSGFPESSWTPTPEANAADKITFSDVDTYANQMDVVYAVANNLSAENPIGTLTLQHAQALLIFNIMFDGSSSKVAFIENNASSYRFRVKELLFLDDNGLERYMGNDPSNPVTAGNVLLKTRGTFTVDNSFVTLKAEWSSLSSQTSAFLFPMDVTARSDANPATSATMPTPLGNTRSSWEVNLQRDKLYQLGNTLLVPGQEVCNIFHLYEFFGQDYSFRVNLPRGFWLPGHKYIYNLVISDVGPESVIDDGSVVQTSGLRVEPMNMGDNPYSQDWRATP